MDNDLTNYEKDVYDKAVEIVLAAASRDRLSIERSFSKIPQPNNKAKELVYRYENQLHILQELFYNDYIEK